MIVKKIGKDHYRRASWWEKLYFYSGRKKGGRFYSIASCLVGAINIVLFILIISRWGK